MAMVDTESVRTIADRYRIGRALGHGGMGSVFSAVDTRTEQRVAIKLVTSERTEDEVLMARFQVEAQTTAALDTPHIARTLDSGLDAVSGQAFLVMEYLEGEDLERTLMRKRALPEDVALRIAAQVCFAFKAAHGAGIVHRDVKPANLFLTAVDGEYVVKLLDFGVAKLTESLAGGPSPQGLTQTGSMLGSPLYMSPEQARGHRAVDARSDLWSLGVVLYQMLTGSAPHGGIQQIGDLIFHICGTPPRPIREVDPNISAEAAAIVHRALQLDPADRFASADQMLSAIIQLLPDGWVVPGEMLGTFAESEAPGQVRSGQRSGRPRSARRGSQRPLGAENGTTLPGDSDRTLDSGSGFGPISGPPSRESGPGTTPPLPLPSPMPRITVASQVPGTATTFVSKSESSANRTAVTIGAIALALFGAAAFWVNRNGSPPNATPTAGVSAAVAPARTARVLVAPEGVRVEVAGRPVTLVDGALVLEGPPGSVHRVRVIAPFGETATDVVITEDGPLPPRIEVAAPAATATATPLSTTTPAPSVSSRLTGTIARPKSPATSSQTAPPIRDDR